jgi:hypothetical protein
MKAREVKDRRRVRHFVKLPDATRRSVSSMVGDHMRILAFCCFISNMLLFVLCNMNTTLVGKALIYLSGLYTSHQGHSSCRATHTPVTSMTSRSPSSTSLKTMSTHSVNILSRDMTHLSMTSTTRLGCSKQTLPSGLWS